MIIPLIPALVVAGVLVAAVGAQTVRLANRNTELAQEKTERATERARASDVAASAVAAGRDDERKIALTIAEALSNERKKNLELAADVRAGFAVADELRGRANSLAAACRGGRPSSAAPAGGGASAPDPGQMLADMLGRMETDGRELAEYADRARIAGETCQLSYEALITRPEAAR